MSKRNVSIQLDKHKNHNNIKTIQDKYRTLPSVILSPMSLWMPTTSNALFEVVDIQCFKTLKMIYNNL